VNVDIRRDSASVLDDLVITNRDTVAARLNASASSKAPKGQQRFVTLL